MRIFVSTILLAATLITANAGDIITATVIVSDADELTNNASITLGSDTRIWTNSVTTPSTQIRSSTTEANAAFNLLQHFRAYHFADVQLQATNNGVVFIGEEGDALDLTITNAWATVAYRTNTVSSATVVRVPPTATAASLREDIANDLADWLNLATDPFNLGSVTVNDDAYAAGWNGSTNVPTKNAIYDKIESLVSGGDDQTAAEVASTPAGNLAADDVQEALNELDTEKAAAATTITIAGTSGEITSSAGAQSLAANRTWTLSLPSPLDLGGKVLEIPNGAAPTTDATGEFALDTTITDHQPLLQYFSGSTEYLVIALPRANLDTTDGDVIKYDAATDSFVMAPDAGASGGDSITVDGAAVTDPDFDDGGDINFAHAAGTITATVKADSVALGTDTTGNYAAGDAEAGAATSGDSATGFFSSGTIEDARLPSTQADKTLTSAIVTLNGTADGLTDDTYDGITITGRNAGETVAQWELVRFNSADSEFHLADADAAGEFPARGIAVAASTDGNSITVLVQGVVRNDGWAWGTVGGPIYLSTTAGGLTQTAPSTSGNAVQIVGWALSDDEAYLNFSGHWVEAP